MAGTVLVTGGFGLVGSRNRQTADGRRPPGGRRGPRHTRQPQEGARRCPPAPRPMGRPDRSGGGRSAGLRGIAVGDRPPRRDHPAAALSQPRPRQEGQRRRHGGVGARRRGSAESAALRPGVEQRRLRLAQSSSGDRCRSRRYPDRGRSISYSAHQVRGRGVSSAPRASSGSCCGSAGAQPELQRPAAQRRRHLHRERAAHRRPHSHRRRPRRRRRRSRRPRPPTSRARSC